MRVAELSRELRIARSLIQRWNPVATRVSETAVQANEDIDPLHELRMSQQRIREL